MILLITVPIVFLNVTRSRSGTGHPEERALTGPDSSASALDWLRRGHDELRRHRLGPAQKAFARAKQLDPTLAPARQGLVWSHALRMERAEALAEFAALAELRALDFDQVLLWTQIRCAIWDPDKVVPQLRALFEADPNDRGVRLTLAEGLRRLGNTAHPDLAALRGQIALLHQDGRAAIALFRRALASRPDDRGCLSGLAQALRLLGQTQAAEPLIRAVQRHDALIDLVRRASEMTQRDDPELLRGLAGACEALQFVPEARAWYSLALLRDPLNSATQIALYHLRNARPTTPP
jgi:tetratricopeptide (TPR) repeat protein